MTVPSNAGEKTKLWWTMPNFIAWVCNLHFPAAARHWTAHLCTCGHIVLEEQ